MIISNKEFREFYSQYSTLKLPQSILSQLAMLRREKEKPRIKENIDKILKDLESLEIPAKQELESLFETYFGYKSEKKLEDTQIEEYIPAAAVGAASPQKADLSEKQETPERPATPGKQEAPETSDSEGSNSDTDSRAVQTERDAQLAHSLLFDTEPYTHNPSNVRAPILARTEMLVPPSQGYDFADIDVDEQRRALQEIERRQQRVIQEQQERARIEAARAQAEKERAEQERYERMMAKGREMQEEAVRKRKERQEIADKILAEKYHQQEKQRFTDAELAASLAYTQIEDEETTSSSPKSPKRP